MTTPKLIILAAAFLSAIFSTITHAASFQGLGDLPGGSFFSYARAVSADGRIVVGASRSTNGTQAFRWTTTNGMVGLGVISGTNTSSDAYGISADGSVIVGSSASLLGPQAFCWTATNGMIGIGDLPGGNFSSVAFAISGNGQVIVGVGWSTASSSEAFRWTATNGMVGLGDLPGGDFYSDALAISADGSVIVGDSKSAASQPYTEAFRWTEATGMIGLGDLPGSLFTSIAYGISADGNVIVGRGYTADKEEAFHWTTNSGMTPLGFLPCNDWTVARATSGDGSIVIGDPQSSTPCIFIWDASHGIRRLQDVLVNDYGLNLTGWQLVSPQAITPDGKTIVGYGKNPSNNTEAWIANLDLPLLAITRDTANVILSWPTNNSGFVLQTNASLLASNAWNTYSTNPFLLGANFVITNTITTPQQFFRLKR